MENSLQKRNKTRKTRVLRVRKKLKGTLEKPRFSVTKTNKHLFVQLIDDENSKTLLGFGTYSKSFKGTKFQKKSKESAKHLGELVAKKAMEMEIKKVIFDRGRFKYHGIISILAESAKEAGLKF